jgi:hypothetical protein
MAKHNNKKKKKTKRFAKPKRENIQNVKIKPIKTNKVK